jgi:hypothetical protein
VTNPWAKLLRTAPYILPDDLEIIERFNRKLSARNSASEYVIETKRAIPEPFIGNVKAAPVVVLLLNPGFNAVHDPVSHADPVFQSALFENLDHSRRDWPFYFFDPRIGPMHSGSAWWHQKAKRLSEVVPLERLSQNMAVVEWFPYRSTKFKHGCAVPSQQYSFDLVQAAMKRDALIVVARNVRLWEESVPGLSEYAFRLTLSSVRNTSLTPGNLKLGGEKTPAAWDMLVESASR